MPVPTSTIALLWRGCRLRCGVCGTGGLFRRWFTMVDDCPTCGLHFERVEGHWIGAIGINTIVTFGLLLVTMVVGFVLTVPDVPVGALTAVTVGVGVGCSVAFYPVSKTLWTAIDLAMRPPGPDEVYPGHWR